MLNYIFIPKIKKKKQKHDNKKLIRFFEHIIKNNKKTI